MEYNFSTRRVGKSSILIRKLEKHLLNGLNCAIATTNIEKTKTDFKRITSLEIGLVPTDIDNSHT